MAKKQIKQEYVKHPFTRKKLLVIDSFKTENLDACPACKTGTISEVKIVESEHRGGIRYNVISCASCSGPIWTVLC